MSALARHASTRRALRAVEVLRWALLVPLWQCIARAGRITLLRHEIASLERYMAEGQRDGLLEDYTLRMYRLYAQGLRCRLMTLEAS